MMKRCLAASMIGLAALLAACSAETEDPETADEASEVVGAPAELDRRYDAVVALVKPKTLADGTKTYSTFCTGSLIAPNVVLTADHCVAVEGLAPDGFVVAFGGDASKPRKIARVERFDRAGLRRLGERSTTGGDTLLLVLKEAVTDVAPLPLAPLGPDDVGKPFTAIGYGFSDGPRTARGIRRKGKTKVVSIEDAFVTKVGDYRDLGDARICDGDSGGPLLAERDGKLAVAAVLSKNALRANGECGNPATYTRLASRFCDDGTEFGVTRCDGDRWLRCSDPSMAEGPKSAELDCAALSPARRCDPDARGMACAKR